MLVAETEAGYRFVTQPDHALLAGQFADRWGSEAVSPPEARPAATLAAYHHDDGWARYDRRPHLDADGDPVDFTELPPATWIDLYAGGIDSVVALDALAGLLVSMHGAGLRRRQYGLSPSWRDLPPAFGDFVDREESRQRELAAELLEAGRLTDEDHELLATLHDRGEPAAGQSSPLWRDYQRLQAWDVLSLAFGTTVEPPGYQDVGPVPTRDGGEVRLRIEPLGDGRYGIEPYPFDTDPLDVWVPTRNVGGEDAVDERSLALAFSRAEPTRQTSRLESTPP